MEREDLNYRPFPTSLENISLFESKNNIIVPEDLKTYFKILNGTNGSYDSLFFEFYSVDRIKRIDDEYKDWEGIPDFNNIINTLQNFKHYYVFANYSFHLFAYCINLNVESPLRNSVLVVCGDKYKVIANSFTEFVGLYLEESISLQL